MHTKFKGKILTFFSLFLFLILAVWALLSVNGRSVNPNNPDQPFTNKGAIRILNRDLEDIPYVIYIDNQTTRLTENTIRNLDPGRYSIRIEAEKYNSWESEVNVMPGMITEVTPYLVAESLDLDLKTSTTININSIFFSEYTDYAYFTVNNTDLGSEKGIWKISLDETSTIFSSNNPSSIKILNLDPLIEEYVNSGDYSLIPSPDESKILFKTPDKSYIFSTESLASRATKELVNLEEILGFQPQNLYWFKQGGSLIVQDNNLLGELDLSTSNLRVISYKPNSSPVFAINGDTVFYYDQSKKIITAYKDTLKTELKLENQILPKSIESLWVGKTNSNYLILKSTNKFYFLDIEKSFIDLIDENIEIMDYSADGKSLLYIKDSNVFSYFLDEINPINDYHPSKSLIISSYNPATTAAKFNSSSSHILIYNHTPEAVKTIEIIEKNGQNKYQLFKGDNLVGKNYSMIKSNKELILLLRTDSLSNAGGSTTNIQKNNLYSLNLEV